LLSGLRISFGDNPAMPRSRCQSYPSVTGQPTKPKITYSTRINQYAILSPVSQAFQIIDQSPPARQPYQDYSPQFKTDALILLEAKGGLGKIRETARELNIPEKTLRYWIEQDTDEMRQIRAGAKGEVADAFERISRIYLDRAAEPDAIAKTSGYYAVVAASDAIKSAQLLRGQPTSITAAVMGEEDRRLKVAELLSRIADRRQVVDVTPEPQQIESE